MAHYDAAKTNAEAIRWSALARCTPGSMKIWIKDDIAMVRELTASLRTRLDPHLRMQLEAMRARYEREATYLQAVLDGYVSRNARVLRESDEKEWQDS
jgi:hypothetical protein